MTDIEAVVLGLKKWAVVHAENEAVLAAMVADSVDHTITDPPYNERTHTKARTLKGGGSDIPIDFDPFSDYSQVNVWLGLTRRWVIAFCALEQLGFYEQAAGPWVKNQQGGWVRAGVWHRTDGTPQLSADRPAQGLRASRSFTASPRVWGGTRAASAGSGRTVLSAPSDTTRRRSPCP